MHPGSLNSLLGLSALGLSWLSGYFLMRVLVKGRGDGAVAAHVGFGYFLGLLMTVTMISVLARVGLGVQEVFLPAVVGLCLIIVAVLVLQARRTSDAGPNWEADRWFGNATRLQKWLFAALTAWVVVRLGMVFAEAGLRPLFPWDAWMHWSPKAKVWIETGQWLEFGSRSSWLADGTRSIYTIRNWSYPTFVPLVQTWTLMPIGEWHETAFGFSWALALPAILLAAYATARHLGCDPLASVGLCWVLVSLPFLHVHAALPGYADLWLGAYASLAAASVLVGIRIGGSAWLLLGMVMAVSCTWIKSPGLAWLAVLSCGVLAWLPARTYQLWTMLTVALFVAALILIGVDFELPIVGAISLNSEGFDLPLIGGYQWQFNPVIVPMLEQLFVHPEWHFFWWLFVIAWVYNLFSRTGDRASLAGMMITGAGVLFLVVAILFTSRGADLEVTRLTHRAYLPLAMIGAMCLPALLCRPIERRNRRGADLNSSDQYCKTTPGERSPI